MRLLVALTGLAFFAGCTNLDSTGASEPILVENGTFLKGALPGTPLPDGGSTPDAGPQVPDVETVSTLVTQGEVGHNFSGHVTPDSYSIAVRFQDAGSGYWVTPAGGPDPTDDNLLAWSFNADFSFDAPLGLQNLLFSAVDGSGHAGAQQPLQLCVVPDYPDNYNVCYPTRQPPAAIVSLIWDSNADLDLVLRTPDGQLVDPKQPTTANITGGADGGTTVDSDPTVGTIDRDSNGNCVEDNHRREDAVWTKAPTGGTYDIYANEFSACGTTATTFTIVTMREVTNANETYSLTTTQTVAGQFLASQANGNDGDPLYVTSISFP